MRGGEEHGTHFIIARMRLSSEGSSTKEQNSLDRLPSGSLNNFLHREFLGQSHRFCFTNRIFSFALKYLYLC